MEIKATKQQKKIIHTVVPRDIKEEYVQWATEDVAKTSTNDLTFDQANMILEKFKCTPHKLGFLATFDKDNARHRFLLSLCIQYGWKKKLPKYGWVANTDKLNEWMHSTLCPVPNVALMKMTPDQLSKVIAALENMTLKKFS